MKIMYEHVNKRNGKWSPLLADDVYEIIKEVRAEPYPNAERERRVRRPPADHITRASTTRTCGPSGENLD